MSHIPRNTQRDPHQSAKEIEAQDKPFVRGFPRSDSSSFLPPGKGKFRLRSETCTAMYFLVVHTVAFLPQGKVSLGNNCSVLAQSMRSACSNRDFHEEVSKRKSCHEDSPIHLIVPNSRQEKKTISVCLTPPMPIWLPRWYK